MDSDLGGGGLFLGAGLRKREECVCIYISISIQPAMSSASVFGIENLKSAMTMEEGVCSPSYYYCKHILNANYMSNTTTCLALTR